MRILIVVCLLAILFVIFGLLGRSRRSCGVADRLKDTLEWCDD